MKKIIRVLVIIILISVCFYIAQRYNFNGLKLAHLYDSKTKVMRDITEQYNGEWGYKIESLDYNDFMIYKTLKVEKNTAYKISCMVKTKDVISEIENSGGGFNIGLRDEIDKSKSIFGTNDWTNLSFCFNSNNNEEIDIAFRLGENTQNCKGTVWITNIQIEGGRQSKTRDWNFGVFLINNVEINEGGISISENLDNYEISTIKSAFSSFKGTLEDFSNKNIKVYYEFISIDKPLTKLTNSEDSGYFISKEDTYKLINDYVKEKQYDHIFIVADIGDSIGGEEISWVGLGGMLYNNIGYSNIRISDSTISMYRYSSVNYFQEEVILHEFLHTLERNSKQHGYNVTALHDYEKFKYTNESKNGQRKWYIDYIHDNINGGKGITEDIYYTQPLSDKNFIKITEENNLIYDNQNIVQKINEKISRIL